MRNIIRQKHNDPRDEAGISSYTLYSIPLPLGTQNEKKKPTYTCSLNIEDSYKSIPSTQEYKSTSMTQPNPARWHLYCVYTN